MFSERSAWLPPESSSEATQDLGYCNHSNKVILLSYFAPLVKLHQISNRYHVKALLQKPRNSMDTWLEIGTERDFCTEFCIRRKSRHRNFEFSSP